MKKELLIIKLGGAAITDKNTPFTPKKDNILKIMKQITEIDIPLIIVHGAGSFAHTLAKEYQVVNGFIEQFDHDYQRLGVSKIRNSMQRLHQFILDAAEKFEILTFSLPVSSTMVTENQENEETFFAPYRRALELGFIPISYGDMTLDKTDQGFIVVSGDRIIKILAKYFQDYTIRVIFGTDVDGLFNKDPALPGAELVKHIGLNEIKDWLSVAGASAGIDVTGGMAGKLLQIDEIAQFVDRIDIINLNKDDRLVKLLKNDDVPHTKFI